MFNSLKYLSAFLLALALNHSAKASEEPNGPDPFAKLDVNMRIKIIAHALDEESGIKTLVGCRGTSRSLYRAASAGKLWIRYLPKLNWCINVNIGGAFIFVEYGLQEALQKTFAHVLPIVKSSKVNDKSLAYRWSSYRVAQAYFRAQSNMARGIALNSGLAEVLPEIDLVAQCVGTCILNHESDALDKDFRSWASSETFDDCPKDAAGTVLLHRARQKIYVPWLTAYSEALEAFKKRIEKIYNNSKNELDVTPEESLTNSKAELLGAVEFWKNERSASVLEIATNIAQVNGAIAEFLSWRENIKLLDHIKDLLDGLDNKIKEFEE